VAQAPSIARETEAHHLVSVNPATNEVLGHVPVTTGSQMAQIIRRSQRAYEKWRMLRPDERARHLAPLRNRLDEQKHQLATLITGEMGKPFKDSVTEVQGQIDKWSNRLAEIVDALQVEKIEDENTVSEIYRDPFGVCAVIAPWNFPLAEVFEMSIPALVGGNTVLVKPSDETPLVAKAAIELLAANLPEDVVQVVYGGDEQGKALVADAGVALVVFTGSREAGKHIMENASKGLKRVLLELGGKDPMIVLDDADLDTAARFAVFNSFRNAGQVCVSTERIYVHQKIVAAFTQRVVELAKTLRIGAGNDDSVQIGPMVSNAHKQRVIRCIEGAKKQGARAVLDGAAAAKPTDNFLGPSVLTDLNQEMDIMQHETFGPVACILAFETDDEAVLLANDSPYGLGAIVLGTNEERATNVGRQINAGMVGINKRCSGAFGSPWVGSKQSGYGWHSGKEGHRNFVQIRVVSRPKRAAEIPWPS
jgi:acyl-CoA reductase-like NAD-dependent aldehyde dehydrogenase